MVVRRVVGTFVPWLGVSLVVYSCAEQSDAPPAAIAGKGGASAGGGAGRAQSGNGGEAHGGSDAAGAGAPAGSGGSGSAGSAGRAGRGGSAGSSGSSPGGGGQTTGNGTVGRCDSPEPWSANLVGCEGDYVHRPAAGVCELPPRNAEGGAAGASPGNASVSCQADADCNQYADGYCIENLADAPQCAYGCRQDADCRSEELCACVEGKRAGTNERIALGVCVAADCRVDADCGTKSLCVSGLALICVQGTEWWPDHFHCQSAADECNGTFDCGEGGQSDFPPTPHCNYGYNEQHFVCRRTPDC